MSASSFRSRRANALARCKVHLPLIVSKACVGVVVTVRCGALRKPSEASKAASGGCAYQKGNLTADERIPSGDLNAARAVDALRPLADPDVVVHVAPLAVKEGTEVRVSPRSGPVTAGPTAGVLSRWAGRCLAVSARRSCVSRR